MFWPGPWCSFNLFSCNVFVEELDICSLTKGLISRPETSDCFAQYFSKCGAGPQLGNRNLTEGIRQKKGRGGGHFSRFKWWCHNCWQIDVDLLWNVTVVSVSSISLKINLSRFLLGPWVTLYRWGLKLKKKKKKRWSVLSKVYAAIKKNGTQLSRICFLYLDRGRASLRHWNLSYINSSNHTRYHNKQYTPWEPWTCVSSLHEWWVSGFTTTIYSHTKQWLNIESKRSTETKKKKKKMKHCWETERERLTEWLTDSPSLNTGLLIWLSHIFYRLSLV